MAIAMCAASSSTKANEIALDFTGGSGQYFPGYSVGWTFSLSAPFTVGNLGWYDAGLDGFLESHSVGIFTNAGALLTSTTVVSSDELVGKFRYAAITPFVLAPGNYVIAGTSGEDLFQAFSTSVTTAVGITFNQGRFIGTGNNTLTFPTAPSDRGIAYFGPNFSSPGAAVAVPDAGSTLGMLGVAFSALASFGLRRH